MPDRNQETTGAAGSTRHHASGPLRVVRGLVLIALSFAALFVFLTVGGPTPAQNRPESDEADFPLLFRLVDRRLQESYLDLDRAEPGKLARRAFSALEHAADEVYVENADPDEPYVAVHVSDKVQVFPLNNLRSRSDMVRLLEKTFDFLDRYYRGERSLNELRYAVANGYLSGVDPHTLVFTPESFEEFEVHIKGEIFGVGMLVGQNDEGRLQVKQVLKDTPAARAGFKRDDLIMKIEDESTVNMTVSEAVQRIRGPRHSKVTLTVKRRQPGSDAMQTLPISVERDRVEIKSVESKLLEPFGSTSDEGVEKGSGVGYVQVTNFDKNTFPGLVRNLEGLREANGGKPLAGLILDLRGNSGGLLNQAVDMADLFLTEGEIVGTAYKTGRPTYKMANSEGTEPGYPIIVLGDEGSASGAEIVIGALQKNGRALVLGTPTFGKGSVQQLQALPHGAQLKITVSEYLLPGNVSIQETGVVPDILCEGVILDDGYSDLIPDRNVMTERDYENHLVSKYKRDEQPSHRLKYLVPPSDGEDGVSQQESFITGDLHPELDPLVRVGLRLISLAGDRLEPKAFLRDHRDGIEAVATETYAEIVDRLAELGIDWSAPATSDEGSPKLEVSLEYEIVEEPPSDPDESVTVQKILVRATVKNSGSAPAWRAKGLSHSDYYLFEEKEFLFGKVGVGETVTREESIRLPYFPNAQRSLFGLDVSGADDRPLGSGEIEVEIPGKPRPALAYSARLLDAEGREIERLGEGVSARLAVRIVNTGEGPIHGGVAVLRNKTGREIFLEKGRIEFDAIAPAPSGSTGAGEEDDASDRSREVIFEFTVRGGKPGDEPVEGYDFELAIVDSYSSESLVHAFVIPATAVDAPPFPNGKVFEAPTIELSITEAPNGDSILSTTRSDVRARAEVSTRGEPFSLWGSILPLSSKTRQTDKFYYAESRGEDLVSFDAPVRLTDGVNVVSIVAKARSGIERRRSVVVRKAGGETRRPTLGAAARSTPDDR